MVANVDKRVDIAHWKYLEKINIFWSLKKDFVITHKQNFGMFDHSHDVCDHS